MILLLLQYLSGCMVGLPKNLSECMAILAIRLEVVNTIALKQRQIHFLLLLSTGRKRQ